MTSSAHCTEKRLPNRIRMHIDFLVNMSRANNSSSQALSNTVSEAQTLMVLLIQYHQHIKNNAVTCSRHITAYVGIHNFVHDTVNVDGEEKRRKYTSLANTGS